MMGTSVHDPPPAPYHLTYVPVNKILGDYDGRRAEWHRQCFIQTSLYLPFSPIMGDTSFLLIFTDLEVFFTPRPDSFEAWEHLFQKRIACRTEMQAHYFWQKTSHQFQRTLSGIPGSLCWMAFPPVPQQSIMEEPIQRNKGEGRESAQERSLEINLLILPSS